MLPTIIAFDIKEVSWFMSMKLKDLVPDDRNANKGTERGREMVGKSLEQFGAGRSILLDKDNKIVAGNKTVEQAIEKGYQSIKVIETDGSELVAVKRTDIKLDSPKGRGLAIADNRTSEIGLEWNIENLKEFAEDLDLSDFWGEGELQSLLLFDSENIDYEEMWQGMPEFEQESVDCFCSIKVNIKTEADLQTFADMVGQKITEKTKSIDIPQRIREDLSQFTVEASEP